MVCPLPPVPHHCNPDTPIREHGRFRYRKSEDRSLITNGEKVRVMPGPSPPPTRAARTPICSTKNTDPLQPVTLMNIAKAPVRGHIDCPSMTSSESSFVVPDQEDAEEKDEEWVTRAEADHARRMVVALLEDQTCIQYLEKELVSSQEMVGMMGETTADLSCRTVEKGFELAQSREQGIVLLWMVLVLIGFVMALFLTG